MAAQYGRYRAASTLVRPDRPGPRPSVGTSTGNEPPPPWPGPRFPVRGFALRGLLPDVAVSIFLGVLYVNTLLPSIGYHMDTSKFGYLGQVLGTGHPPGEPLYLMINAGWIQALPFGNPAWRANLLSAVFAVLACLVLMRVLRELGLGRWLAAAGAAMIGVSRLFWQQAIVAEVYSLNALFVAAVLYLLLVWLRTRRDAVLVTALGLFELSFSNHPTGVVLLPGLAVFLWRGGAYRVLLRVRNLLALVGYGLATMSTYGYIVWRSLDPATPYLELDIHDLGSFWEGVTAEQFQGSMFGYGPADFVTQQIPFAFGQLWLQYFLLAAAGVWGAAVLLHRRPHTGMLLLLWFAGVTMFAMGYLVSDSEVFYYVSWIVLGLWICVGLADLARRAPGLLALLADRLVNRLALRPRWRRLALSPGWQKLAALPTAAAVAAPLALAAANYTRVDLSDSDEREKLARIVEQVPRESIVFTPTFLGYQELNYFLIPGGEGQRRHVYADMGAGRLTDDAEWTAVGGLQRYCRPSDGHPIRLEWIRTTVPRDLNVFVYTEEFADLVSRYGYPVRPVGAELYRISCDRFGALSSMDRATASRALAP